MAFTPRTETYVNVSSLTFPYNITVTKPTGTENGDILFCWICTGNINMTIDSVPGGWTLLGSYTASTERYYLYYKIAADEPASWVWSIDRTGKVRAVCSCYTGGDFDPEDPIDVVSNTSYRTSDTNCIAASMVVAAAKSPLIFWAGCYYSAGAATFTKPSVPSADWIEDDDDGSGTPDMWTEICSMIWAGSGATGDMSATISVTITTKHAFAVALNPSTATEYREVIGYANPLSYDHRVGAGLRPVLAYCTPLGFLHLLRSATIKITGYASPMSVIRRWGTGSRVNTAYLVVQGYVSRRAQGIRRPRGYVNVVSWIRRAGQRFVMVRAYLNIVSWATWYRSRTFPITVTFPSKAIQIQIVSKTITISFYERTIKVR